MTEFLGVNYTFNFIQHELMESLNMGVTNHNWSFFLSLMILSLFHFSIAINKFKKIVQLYISH